MKVREKQGIGLDMLLKQAFGYWISTLLFQLLFSIIYFSLLLFVIFVVGEKYGVVEEYFRISKEFSGDIQGMQQEIQLLQQTPAFMSFSWYILGSIVFLFPLSVGFFEIYRKKDNNEKVRLRDLFAGYEGLIFIKFLSFYLFWFIIYSYMLPTIILAVIWVIVTLFCGPIMYFSKKGIFESISLSIQAVRKYFLEIFVCVLVGFIFKYAGILVFFFGIILTYPFMVSVIYTLYRNIFDQNFSENDKVDY